MAAAQGQFVDAWWHTPDDLRLHYRDYLGRADRPTILCLPGLSRNARDFEEVAARLAPNWRVVCAELRGRGESAYAPDPASYRPATYLADLAPLLATLGRMVLFGTSLGGILSMLLTAAHPGQVAGVLLNDIGPVVEPQGLARIRGTVGRGASWPTWVHAARALAEMQDAQFPRYALPDWIAMAKRLCRLTSAGRIVFDYDLRIAEPLREDAAAVPADLWPAFDALAGRPVLLVRGARSDILSAGTAAAMAARHRALELVTVDDVGHVPTLTEPAAVAAVDRLLLSVR